MKTTEDDMILLLALVEFGKKPTTRPIFKQVARAVDRMLHDLQLLIDYVELQKQNEAH